LQRFQDYAGIYFVLFFASCSGLAETAWFIFLSNFLGFSVDAFEGLTAADV